MYYSAEYLFEYKLLLTMVELIIVLINNALPVKISKLKTYVKLYSVTYGNT